MKHTRTAQKVLSLALTGALLLPSLTGITPAMAASGDITAQLGSTPISLNFTAGSSGKWTPSEEPGQRLWLNVDDNTAVVDEFSYTVTSDKGTGSDRYQVDEYGYLTLKEGELPIEGETLTVEASVDYYEGEGVVLFADNVVDTKKEFTTGTSGSNVYSYQIMNQSNAGKQVARTGEYGITTEKTGWNAAPRKVISETTGVLTAWLYDPWTAEDSAYTASEEGQLCVHLNSASETTAASYLMGIAGIKDNNYAKNTYTYRAGASGATYKSGDARSEGWHKLAWVVSDSGMSMYIDDMNTPVHTDTSVKTITSVSISNNKGKSTYSTSMLEGNVFLDDISVIATGAETSNGSISIQIPVDYTAPKAPVISTQPTGQTVAEGETVTLTVVANDPTGGQPSYQWYKAATIEATGDPIDLATSATLELADVTTADTGYYYCNVTNANGTTKSDVVKVTALGQDSRPAQPGSPSIGEDGSVTFAYSGQGDISFKMSIYRSGEDTPAATATKVISLNNSNWANTNLLTELRTLGEGSYTATATRLGAEGALDSLESSPSLPIALDKLSTPNAPIWVGSTVKWDMVTGAKAYRVQLYADGVKQGDSVTVNAPTTQCLLTITGNAPHTATVTAIADTNTLSFDSAESAQSAARNNELALAFDSGVLNKGNKERVILDAPNEYGILNFSYQSSNDKVSVDKYGYVTVADDYVVPEDGVEVTISADVEYYPTTVWANNMESYGRFDCNELSTPSTTYPGPRLNLTGTSALPGGEAARTGRMGATPYAQNGYGSNVKLQTATTGSVFFWYYDPYTEAEKTATGTIKYGVSLNVHGASDPAAKNFAGVGYGDGPDTANYANPNFYSYRTKDTDWKNLATPRSTGWHKFEFRVTSAGMELYIDGVKVRDLDTSIKTITGLQLCNNWGTQSDAARFANGKHFIDDIFVVSENTKTTQTKLSTTIKVMPKSYSVSPESVSIDLNYPSDLALTINPDLDDFVSAALNGVALVKGTDFVLTDNLLTIKKEYFNGKDAGDYTLTLTMTEGKPIVYTIKAERPAARSYYVNSITGNDANDGLTPATAWKSLAKLNAAAPFHYGDRIYLEANSVWNGQLVLSGDGKPGSIISLTRYTVEDGVTKYGVDCTTQSRPVINGNGTVGTTPSYIVENAHDGRYKFSGAVELWNSEYWEISWLEVTNLGETSKDGNGRCGIMVMNEWAYEGDMAQQTKNFYDSKKTHIYITDSYVHDVNGLFQDYKDVNNVNGTKHSGGIIGFGYISDFQVERCRVSKVDIEGIRTTIFHPQGTQNAASYPPDLETNTLFRNNFIDKLHGDAMVIAGGVGSAMEYNVSTTLGRSYVSKADNSNYVPGTEPVNLGTNKNFAAIWFMGCNDSVAQYNECYDTQYFTPNDGEAWDIDMQSHNVVYQYNYSHHNAGGCVLFMNSGCTNNIFRYNLSIEDGGDDYNPHTLFYVVAGQSSVNSYPLVYNNIFTIAPKVTAFIDGSGRDTKYLHFQNNIILAADGITNRPAFYGQSYPGTSFTTGKITGGEFTNNIVWPSDLYTKFEAKLGDGVSVKNNQIIDPKLVDISKTPTLSEAWTTEVNSTDLGDDTTGIILSGDNWFDAKVNELLGGYKLRSDSPAIGKGVRVPYWTGVPVEKRFPLERDFFGTFVDEIDPNWVPDIGIHEYTDPVPAGSSKVSFSANGGTTQAAPMFIIVENGKAVGTLPTEPTHADYLFDSWNTQRDGSGSEFTAETIVNTDLAVYAQWKPLHYTYTVTFDKNGGDTEASPSSKTITEPATSLGSLPTAPTRAGNEFAGWNTKADGTGSVFTAKSKLTGSVTVYAQWKPIGSFTVTYDKNGGDTEASPAFQIVTPPAVSVGTFPAAPTRSGYTFNGWNTAKAGSGSAFTTSTEVTGNITVYAQWEVYTPSNPSTSTPTPKPEEKPAENVTATEGGKVTVKENKDGSSTYTFKPEKDKEVLYVRVNGLLVKADSYTAAKGEVPSIVVVFGESGADHSKDYADTAELPEYMTDAVNYVVGSGLFQGNGESFVPMGNMNRAMFATVLARLYGADTSSLTSDFADVAQNSWYAGSVAWISDMGITSGVGNGSFAPEADMTRQELVTLVYRFAQKVGADASASGDLAAFSDADSVNTWSTEAMSWAVGLGILNGKSGSLAPNDTITRVEAAIILQRMADLLVKGK